MQHAFVLALFFIVLVGHPAFIQGTPNKVKELSDKQRADLEEKAPVDPNDFVYDPDFGARKPLTPEEDMMLRKKREKLANETDSLGCFFCRPGTHTGTIDGADYVFVMPRKWNGVS